MLSLFSLRFAGRRVAIFPGIARASTAQSAWVPNPLTRSFITSVVRAEPAKAKTATVAKTKTSTKAGAKKTKTAKKPVKKVAAKKKPAKKVVTKLIIPRSTKIPSRGPTPYIYFFSKVFMVDKTITQENFSQFSRDAGAAWKALPEAEKQKYRDLTAPLREQARKERQAYTNALEPKIIKELNRRRVSLGKKKLHKKLSLNSTGRPLNGYIRFAVKYRTDNNITGDVIRQCAAAWKALDEDAKQVYRNEYEAELVDWKASIKTEA